MQVSKVTFFSFRLRILATWHLWSRQHREERQQRQVPPVISALAAAIQNSSSWKINELSISWIYCNCVSKWYQLRFLWIARYSSWIGPSFPTELSTEAQQRQARRISQALGHAELAPGEPSGCKISVAQQKMERSGDQPISKPFKNMTLRYIISTRLKQHLSETVFLCNSWDKNEKILSSECHDEAEGVQYLGIMKFGDKLLGQNSCLYLVLLALRYWVPNHDLEHEFHRWNYPKLALQDSKFFFTNHRPQKFWAVEAVWAKSLWELRGYKDAKNRGLSIAVCFVNGASWWYKERPAGRPFRASVRAVFDAA